MTDEQHEIINFSPKIPFRIFMSKVRLVRSHWHESPELLMVLDGEMDLTVDGEVFHLTVEDIVLINSNSIHEIRSQGAVMLTLQMKMEAFTAFEANMDTLFFSCNSAEDDNEKDFPVIRSCIAQMLWENTHRNEGSDYKNMALGYELIAEMVNRFSVPVTEEIRSKKRYINRLAGITEYIETHYRENFGLKDLADDQQLSVSYLSTFFNKYMGQNFSQYYTNVKLEHAVSDLMKTDDSIETVAVNNGFTESHSFVRCFKKVYHMLPSEYRKQQKEQLSQYVSRPASTMDYLMIEPGNHLHFLTKYLPAENSIRIPYAKKSETVYPGDLSASRSGKKLKHTFKKFISVGRAKDLLNHSIQEMLRDVQENIGYEFIKFHGLFADDMMVCSRINGELVFNFLLIDMALDFLMSVNLKPMIQLSFMPTELAADRQKTVYSNPFNTSPPAHMEEWVLLVQDFTRHLFGRYGKEEVRSWLFCVWNEPDTSEKMFGFKTDSQFFEFYKTTYQTVRAMDSELTFGSPSLLCMTKYQQAWIRDFLAFAKREDCWPDFMNIHYYSDICPETADDFWAIGAANTGFPENPDDFGEFIGNIRKFFRSCGAGNLPVYLTEWNFTFSHRNLINDTCFKSCYILKNLLKNYDRLDSFGYWSLTDLIEELPMPEQLFHGGMGMYTVNGIRKNVFYAFYFANMLGDQCLASGDGYFITSGGNDYQIITYNYLHYGDLFAAGEMFGITETSRYSTFNMSHHLSVSLNLTDILNGQYEVREYFVNRQYGSAFDLWVRSGGAEMNPQDMQLLKNYSVPGFYKKYEIVDNHSLHYRADLEPLEIRFAEICLISDNIQ